MKINENNKFMNKIYYKVVTTNLKSLGLRKNPNIMIFPLDEWVFEPIDRIDYSKNDLGGIWVAQTLSGAKGLLKYMKNKKILMLEYFNVKLEISYMKIHIE